ncbi:MAG: LL-diaminopimelate aminotransferase [Clostridiales bacterium]|nr:LL-diaminopimelate aminotransferase [Clostridiales bacterium]
MRINDEYGKLPGSYLFAETARRLKVYQAEHPDADIIRLGIGDVTMPLVPAVISAMHIAVDEMGKKETFRGYGPDYGYDFLVNAIRENDYQPYGIELDYDEVFISDGAKCDVGNIQELFSPDAVIAVTDPVYPVYVDSNAMAGRAGDFLDGKWDRLVYLPCNAENGFVPELPSEHVDVLYLCYPNNPTGTVLTKAQLKVFVDWARENDALIIYDAAYKAFITETGIPHSIYEVAGAKEVAIECCSYSKTAGFTGTRCAYMIVPHEVQGLNSKGERVELNAMWKRRMSTKFNGVSYPVQRAAAAIYTPEGKKQVQEVIQGYLENARVIHDGLISREIEVYGGINSPYIWMKVPGNMDSWTFFDRLMDKSHVVGTPGAGFGPSGEGYFRLTAFNSLEATKEAVRRFDACLL